MFAYCENDSVNVVDPMGYIATAIAISTFLISCAAIISLLSWMNTAEFKNSWRQFCISVGNGLSWMAAGIKNAKQAVKEWTLKQILLATAALATYNTIAKADSKIRKIVKKNSKNRYWTATVRKNYVDIGRAITYNTAVRMVSQGSSVFTVTKNEAKAVAKAAYSNKNPIGPEIHGNGALGYYWHFHRNGHLNGHIYFLFW